MNSQLQNATSWVRSKMLPYYRHIFWATIFIAIAISLYILYKYYKDLATNESTREKLHVLWVYLVAMLSPWLMNMIFVSSMILMKGWLTVFPKSFSNWSTKCLNGAGKIGFILKKNDLIDYIVKRKSQAEAKDWYANI